MSATSVPSSSLDFNQLLRESTLLASAMQGVSTAYTARGGAAGTSAGASGGLSSLALASSAGAGNLVLQRNLAQLSAASRRLARQQPPSDAAADSQAQLVLSAKGIDLRKQARALKDMEVSLPSARAAATRVHATGLESCHPLDIDRYLQHQQQALCHAAMEEAAEATSETYRLHDLSSLSDDWESSKREILDSLGFRGGASALGVLDGSGAEKRKAAPALKAGPAGPVLAMEQAIYARTIQDLNRARVRRAPVDILASLQLASAQVDEYFAREATPPPSALAPGDVADCWDVLRCMLQDANGDAAAAAQPITERAYARAWNAPASSPEFARLRGQLVFGARRYTERLFEAYVRQVVAKHPEARRLHHGKSTFAQQVAAYVHIRAGQLPPACREALIDGVPLWPQVYFCLRCGRADDALDLLHRYLAQAPMSTSGGVGGFGARGGVVAVASVESRALVEALEKRVGGGARSSAPPTAPLWIALHDEYQREVSAAVNSARAHGGGSAHAAAYVDPFKLALYHLLGRFRLPAWADVSAHVAPTTEDYLWLKLGLLADADGDDVDPVRIGSSAVGAVPDALRDVVDASSLRLAALQSDLLARGEPAFNPDGRHPLAYFKVLLLAQQFEQAVYFLLRTTHFTVAVHFAIALHHAGVLREHANAAQDLLVAVEAGASAVDGLVVGESRFALHYARVLRKYVEAFVRTHAREAFHYLYLLHTIATGGVAAKRSRVANGVGLGLLPAGTAAEDESFLSSSATAANAAVNTADPSFAAMRDLLLETREYDLLVGSISSGTAGSAGLPGVASAADSLQTRGLLYQFYTRGECAHLLAHTGATLAEHGLVGDAVRLYLLAYRFDLAVETLLRAMSPLVPQSIQTPERQQLVDLAQQVYRVVRQQQAGGHLDSRAHAGADDQDASVASDAALRALRQLLLLVNYFDLYHIGPHQYEAALVALATPELALLPFRLEDVDAAASQFEDDAATHIAVRRCISEVVVSVMDIYYVQYQMCKREMARQNGYGVGAAYGQKDHAKQQRLQTIRSQARALMSFLGIIHSSMQIDADLYGKLVSIEALMAA